MADVVVEVTVLGFPVVVTVVVVRSVVVFVGRVVVVVSEVVGGSAELLVRLAIVLSAFETTLDAEDSAFFAIVPAPPDPHAASATATTTARRARASTERARLYDVRSIVRPLRAATWTEVSR
ncbi:MAG TPA: hypothetical protein VMU39_19530 [Solirubrobacteraceae bacterium]|nr:hypothetical protein [Solirubrobacteraceae bacterium]